MTRGLAIIFALVLPACSRSGPTTPRNANATAGADAATTTPSAPPASSATPLASIAPVSPSAIPTTDGGGATDPVESLAQAAFEKIDSRPPSGKDVSWSHAITPAVPAHWPPTGEREVVRYVYARGTALSLRDGEHVSAPFARIVSSQGAPARTEMSSRVLSDLGVQGVRPLSQRELAIPSVNDVATDLAAIARGPAPSQPTERIRLAYCQWQKTNGVIAEVVIKKHPAFFAWLACPQGRP